MGMGDSRSSLRYVIGKSVWELVHVRGLSIDKNAIMIQIELFSDK